MAPDRAEGDSVNASSVSGNQFHNNYGGSPVTDVRQTIHAPVYNPQAHMSYLGSRLFEAPVNASELHEKERYVYLMSDRGRGSALWYPSAGTEGQSGGIRIGDVGIMRPDRAFDCLFNIRQEYATDPINKHLPHDFIYCDSGRLDLDKEDQQDTHVAVNLKRLSRSNNHCYEFESRDHSQPGAILVLPDYSHQETLLNDGVFLQLAVKHSQKWFTHARKDRRRWPADVLFLVTGVEKSQSWGICSFKNEQPNTPVPLRFKLERSGEREGDRTTYSWIHTDGATYHSYPHDRVTQVGTGASDQTLFVRGFVITRDPPSVHTSGPANHIPEVLAIYFRDPGQVYHQLPESEDDQEDLEDPRSLVASGFNDSSPGVSHPGPHRGWYTELNRSTTHSTTSESRPDSSQDTTSAVSGEFSEDINELLQWAVARYGSQPNAEERARICNAVRCSQARLTRWLESHEGMPGQQTNDEDAISTPIIGDNATTRMDVHETRRVATGLVE
ncbi:hypothetical protein PQX77_017081 [Marasmius sp. AFHP31]|nr:hypothetical protein PQX77_017081 [Marasmius sp. AFHP31]